MSSPRYPGARVLGHQRCRRIGGRGVHLQDLVHRSRAPTAPGTESGGERPVQSCAMTAGVAASSSRKPKYSSPLDLVRHRHIGISWNSFRPTLFSRFSTCGSPGCGSNTCPLGDPGGLARNGLIGGLCLGADRVEEPPSTRVPPPSRRLAETANACCLDPRPYVGLGIREPRRDDLPVQSA